MTTTHTITPQTARHILHHFGEPGGIRPGSFTERLIAAMATADQSNLAKLADGFPELTYAFQLAAFDWDGLKQLRQIAGADEC